jgi:hypothetical protein
MPRPYQQRCLLVIYGKSPRTCATSRRRSLASPSDALGRFHGPRIHHQPEAQHPKSSAIHKLPADYPIFGPIAGKRRRSWIVRQVPTGDFARWVRIERGRQLRRGRG